MYIGVDTSTRSVCLSILEKYAGSINSEWYWYKLNGDNLFDKMDEAYKHTARWIEDNTGMPEYVIVGIEEPVYIQNGKTHKMLCCIYASVVRAFMDSKIIPQPVNISTWKKVVVGKGNSNKQQVKERVMNLLSLPDDLEQDVYDALGIATYMWKGGDR